MAQDDDILRGIAAGSRRIDATAFRMLFRYARTLNDRLADLERTQFRADVVDALPDNAPVGYLIRLRGDLSGALYLGNGPVRPLTKLLPGPL